MGAQRMTGLVAAMCLVLLAAADTAAGADASPPAIEPAAAKILQSALEKIARAQGIAFRAEIANDTPLPGGEMIQFTGILEVVARRPDRFWSRFSGEQRSHESWFDGKTFTHLDSAGKAYATSAAPGKLDNLFRTMKEKLGFTPPLSLLLRENVAQKALSKVRSGFSVGRAIVGGVACQHLAFRGEKFDWQAWIAEEGEPVIKRIVITYKQVAGSPQYIATFIDWDFAATPPESLFTFTPPQGAVQCDFQTLGK